MLVNSMVSSEDGPAIVAIPLEVVAVALHCLANPAKYQHNNRDEYCNIFVNLSRPSNVNTQVIQFFISTGDFLLEMPVCRMERCDGTWCSLAFMS